MSKEFTPVAFDPRQFKKELDQLRDLLKSKPVFSERDMQRLLKKSLHLTAYIGAAVGLNIGIAKQVAYEYALIGDYAADIVFGNRERQFCFVELEDGDPKSVLRKVGKKATKEVGGRGLSTASVRLWTGSVCSTVSSQRPRSKRTSVTGISTS